MKEGASPMEPIAHPSDEPGLRAELASVAADWPGWSTRISDEDGLLHAVRGYGPAEIAAIRAEFGPDVNIGSGITLTEHNTLRLRQEIAAHEHGLGLSVLRKARRAA